MAVEESFFPASLSAATYGKIRIAKHAKGQSPCPPPRRPAAEANALGRPRRGQGMAGTGRGCRRAGL
jgi:hypothetical protein